MIKFAICNEIFKDWDFQKAVQFVAKTGYDALEIAPFTFQKHVTDISKDTRNWIKQTASDANLAISGIHWVLVETEGMHMTHPEDAIRQRTAKYFLDLVDFCSDIGGKSIVVGSPKQRNLQEGIGLEQGMAWAREVFRESIHRAQDCGVTICLEPLAPSETNFINTAKEAIEFTEYFNSPAFKIILDVKAMCSESLTIPEIIRHSHPNFGYFHANDANLKGPGFGEIDFVPIAGALKEVGYKGYVSVEVFKFDEGAEVIAQKSLDYLLETFRKKV